MDIKLYEFKENLPIIRVKVCEDVINVICSQKKLVNSVILSTLLNGFRCPSLGTSPHLAKYEYSKDRVDFIQGL